MSNAFESVNFETTEGHKIKLLLEERLAEHRGKLENPTLTERDTMMSRGAIAEIKRLLQPAPQFQAPSRYDNGNLGRNA